MTFDKYEIIKPLGQGSFGKVFLVKHRVTGEKLVMKQVPMPRAKAEQEECLREAELMTKLQHPHCVGIYACFIHGNMLCIVMEYCESGDLEKVIRRTKQRGTLLPETIIIDILCQLALSLEYLHNRKQRVLHRDLKAANVFLEKNEDAKDNEPKYNVKLGDFGISRVLDASLLLANTQCGTPCYMAPELYRGTPYGDKADMWSLGVLAYELCALRLPFNGTSMADLGNKVMRTQPASLPGKYSAQLRNLVSSLLEKDPKKRPTAADFLRNDLLRNRCSVIVNFDRATTSSVAGSPPSTGVLPAPSPVPETNNSNVAVARRPGAPPSARRGRPSMAAPATRLPTPLSEEQRSAAIAQGLEAQAMRVGVSPPSSPPASSSPPPASPPSKLPALGEGDAPRRPPACGRRASPPVSPTPEVKVPAPEPVTRVAHQAAAAPAAGKPSGIAHFAPPVKGRQQQQQHNAQVYPGLEGGPPRRVHHPVQQQARPVWMQDGPGVKAGGAGEGAEQRGINEILAANARGMGNAPPRDHRGLAGHGAAGALYAAGQQQQQQYRRAVGAPLPGGWRPVPVY